MDRPSSPAFAAEFWHDEALRLRKTLEKVQTDLGEVVRYESNARVMRVRREIAEALKDEPSRAKEGE